ncbi:MAG: hypothetical protein HY918_02555 [Candidatus Doudnabacteria bacterium]|nr:hypothetical protein [Candidatus Doudnabacteria bacterium]
MYSYEEIKDWLKENKRQLVLAVCFILVFLVGFGSGRFEREMRRDRQKPLTNYTTQTKEKPLNQEGTEAVNTDKPKAAAPIVAGIATTAEECVVKGNISSAKKIYHIAGGAFYKTVKPEQCFKTEAEAQAAGFVKSQR